LNHSDHRDDEIETYNDLRLLLQAGKKDRCPEYQQAEKELNAKFHELLAARVGPEATLDEIADGITEILASPIDVSNHDLTFLQVEVARRVLNHKDLLDLATRH
jgi:hypothetical protein